MSDSPDKLISLYLFDQAAMTPEQGRDLSDWILEHPDNARVFIRTALFHRSIHESFVRSDTAESMMLAAHTDESGQTSQVLNPEIWRLLSEDEKTAPSIECPEPVKKEPVVVMAKAKVENTPWKINKFSIASAIVSLAALLFIIVYVHLVPATLHEEVATLTDTIDAQWAESSPFVRQGARLSTNTKPLMLRKGIAQLRFDNAISVLIEAPAEFVLITGDQVKLNYGRLYAVVPPQAIGFTVTTPNSKIIDLGTEFGVQVDFSETTQLHVIKGKTTLVADQDGQKVSLQVNEGQARQISERSSDVTDISCDTGLFVRQIQSEHNLVWRGGPLGLAAMLDDGSGLNGPQTRTASTRPVVLETPELEPGGYFAVETNPFIDGLFVPNGIHGPVSISQDGQFSWNAPTMEVRQKIGYLRFDISSVPGNRTAAVLGLDVRKWAGKKGQIQVYGLADGPTDRWEEALVTYHTATGLLPAPMGQFRLDQQRLTDLGTISFNGVGMQVSDTSNLPLDDFLAQDTNGLVTFVLVRQQNDLSAEWTIRTKEDDTGSPPTLTFPYGKNGDSAEITTAVSRGADTYLSNDNQYDSTGPDDSHGTETALKIRNYTKIPCTLTNSGQTNASNDAFSRTRPLTLAGGQDARQSAPLLAMHANSAITFDLQEIRNYYNGILSLTSFTAVCGPADVTGEWIAAQQWQQTPQAGFYVLVDGRERFSKIDMLPGEKACPVTVELTPQDRYLTLVTTGGTDRKAPMDWGLFVSPQINVE